MLILNRIIRTEDGVRSFGDQRRRVNRVIAEYRDAAGYTYRKPFECDTGRDPIVPDRGTHAHLNGLKFQFTGV